jgi:membrane protein implicated in regulation of membrane protease activity
VEVPTCIHSRWLLPYVISLIVFLVVLLMYIWYYRRTLSRHKEHETLEKQAEELGIPLQVFKE